MKMETIEELKARTDANREKAERKEMDVHMAHHRAAIAASAEQEQPTHGTIQAGAREPEGDNPKAAKAKELAGKFKAKVLADREAERGRDR